MTDAAPRDPSAGVEQPVWLALMHTAGPNAPAAGEGSVFQHPDFPEHVAFLERLRAAGVLVAAGPLGGPDDGGAPPSSADGMTVVRAAGERQAAELARQAVEEDRSVTRGLLQVHVRHWHVKFTG